LTKQAVDLMKALVCPAHRRVGWDKINLKKFPWIKCADFFHSLQYVKKNGVFT